MTRALKCIPSGEHGNVYRPVDIRLLSLSLFSRQKHSVPQNGDVGLPSSQVGAELILSTRRRNLSAGLLCALLGFNGSSPTLLGHMPRPLGTTAPPLLAFASERAAESVAARGASTPAGQSPPYKAAAADGVTRRLLVGCLIDLHRLGALCIGPCQLLARQGVRVGLQFPASQMLHRCAVEVQRAFLQENWTASSIHRSKLLKAPSCKSRQAKAKPMSPTPPKAYKARRRTTQPPSTSSCQSPTRCLRRRTQQDKRQAKASRSEKSHFSLLSAARQLTARTCVQPRLARLVGAQRVLYFFFFFLGGGGIEA